jgi:hypothetical protein
MVENCFFKIASIARLWSQPRCSTTDGWTRKNGNLYNGVSFSNKKNKFLQEKFGTGDLHVK